MTFLKMRIHLLKLGIVIQGRAWDRRSKRREPRWAAVAPQKCYRKEMSQDWAALARWKVQVKGSLGDRFRGLATALFSPGCKSRGGPFEFRRCRTVGEDRRGRAPRGRALLRTY